MTKQLQVYKCIACGNIVQVLHAADGDLICCGSPLVLLEEGTTDAAKEKHVPVITKTPTGYKVAVGSVAHPMDEKHWIQWIELVADGVSYTRFLNPGEAPEAEFCIAGAKNVYAREFCNLHGHWRADA